MRGKYKKQKGKIIEVDLKLSKVVVEGIQVKKQDGSKVNVKLQPSNLRIVELNLDDKKRSTKLGVKKEAPKKETKIKENKK
jgi:large subunit ribosomal protein L24